LRSVVCLLLVTLLTCPLFCRAAEAGGTSNACCGETDSQPPHSSPPEGASCICGGAVDSIDLKGHDLLNPHLLSYELAFFPLAQLTPTFSSHHLAFDGSLIRLAGWGESLRVRARLQNFRF
jgi:hypothetical protein